VPTHPRITRIAGDPTDRETRRAVFEAIGDCRNVLVVVTPAPQPEVVARFETYAPLVTPDSYLIVEGTILNGHPVMPEFGPGPSEAVRAILRGRSDFVPDHGLERFGVTFNPFGFLKRVG
jgi:cephalosporin hydroxylase